MRRLAQRIRRTVADQRGAVLVLMSMSLVVLMGMAAFAVDYGWIAYNRLEVRKAAEAAALAGVVHMPLPGSTTLGVGAEAYDTALTVALQAGYNGATTGVVVTPAETTSPNQLRVTVEDTIDTFFMRVFVPSPIKISGSALAEQLPPLKIGSDESHLGNTQLGGSDEFWIAINGRRTQKEYGDAYTTHCISRSCSGTTNNEYRNPGHYYAVEVPEGATGPLTVSVFDGTHKNAGLRPSPETGDAEGDDEFKLRFKLFPPDSTPGNWTDNKANNGGVPVCKKTFWNDGAHATRPVGWGVNEWRNLTSCGNAVPGIYVLEVSMDDAGTAYSQSEFSLKATVNGADNVAAVYGLGAMTLYMNASSSTPEFKIVKLDEIYAGTELVLSLFDVGDIGGTGSITFTNAFAGTNCEVQIRDITGTTVKESYKPDHQYPGGLNSNECGIDISNKRYNGEWLDFKFAIPPNYSCVGQACWGKVKLTLNSSNPVDTTTWAAAINGTPVHLEP